MVSLCESLLFLSVTSSKGSFYTNSKARNIVLISVLFSLYSSRSMSWGKFRGILNVLCKMDLPRTGQRSRFVQLVDSQR